MANPTAWAEIGERLRRIFQTGPVAIDGMLRQLKRRRRISFPMHGRLVGDARLSFSFVEWGPRRHSEVGSHVRQIPAHVREFID